MSESNRRTIVIGAGLAGLACALKLREAGHHVLVLESSDSPGGRARTDEVDGYLLDRGFQVYLDAYPSSGKLLDLQALELRKFEPGAMVYFGHKLHRVMDVFRRPSQFFACIAAPIGNLFDKTLVARLRRKVLTSSVEEIWQREDHTTKDYLRRFGFSERMIEGFFGSFYGGIFLERELLTSSRMFEFTFKMFAQGAATVPAKGMGQLAKQLADQLDEGQIQYHCEVASISGNEVETSSGEIFSASHIVVATSAEVTQKLLPHLNLPKIEWRSVTNLYFSADKSPLNEAILALNGEKTGLVNNVAVLTDVSPNYAPAGKALISVSLLGLPEQDDLPKAVQEELTAWFGHEVVAWKHLRTDRIPHALPIQTPEKPTLPASKPPHYLCGDYQESASIEGAIISGQKTAAALLEGSG